MSVSACAAPIPLPELIAYWLGELGGADEARVEEHLFACGDCSDRMQELARLAAGVKRMASSVITVVSAPFIERMREAGLRVRRYDVEPGGGVLCTIAPDDDVVVSYLHASLEGVERLDLELHDSVTDARFRLQDIAFDPAATQVVVIPSTAELRKLGVTTQTMRLVAVAGGRDKPIGEYRFNHRPTPPPC